MPEAPVDVYISAGSNIEPVHHLREAVRALNERFGPLRLSPVYRSAPVGFDGEDFLNLVIAFETDEPPSRLVEYMETLHERAGRDRSTGSLSSHTLDLDLLMYGDRVSDDGIRLPRPDIVEFAFVLAPLADLAPDLKHPVSGQSMSELWADFDRREQPVTRVAIDLR